MTELSAFFKFGECHLLLGVSLTFSQFLAFLQFFFVEIASELLTTSIFHLHNYEPSLQPVPKVDF